MSVFGPGAVPSLPCSQDVVSINASVNSSIGHYPPSWRDQMTRVVVTAVAALAIAASVLLSPVIAQSPTNVPQHVRVSNIAAGTARGSTTFVFEWDQATAPGTKTPYTTYEIGKKCAYT